jgi:hypothetical protein
MDREDSYLGKYIDEKGKLFGLINLIDLGVILLLVVLGIKVFSEYRPAPLDLTEHPVTVGLLIKNVPPYVAESIKLQQELYEDRLDVYLGKIYSVSSKPAEVMLTESGRLVLVQSPRNLDLNLELKRNGRIVTGPARTGVFLGKLPVRIGGKIKAHTLFTSITGEVESIRVQN